MEQKVFLPSLLKGFITKQSKPIEWLQVFNLITSEKLKELTDRFRATKEWRYKASLPCITPSCQLNGTGKEAADIVGLTGVSMVDFDHLPADRIEEIRKVINADVHTFMSYVTVSGEGMRILALTPALSLKGEGDYSIVSSDGISKSNQYTPSPFREREGVRAFLAVNCYYADLIGFSFDEKCSNTNRLSALCYDPKAYFNPKASPLGKGRLRGDCHIGSDSQDLLSPPNLPLLRGGNAVDYAVKVIERSERYEPGNRNQYLMRCLMLMNKLGVPRDEAESWALGHDLGEREIRSVVKSCYSHTSEFGTFNQHTRGNLSSYIPDASLAHTRMRDARESDDCSDDVSCSSAPLLPSYQWPEFIQRMVDYGETDAQRDVILLSSFAVLGSMLSRNLRVLYARKYWYPCLQIFVVAPPASGKGVIGWVRRLAEPVHNEMMRRWSKAMSEYKKQKQMYDAAGREKANMEVPEAPAMSMFLIAGNNTSTGILENIMDADGWGLVCEAEADTVSAAINADYGGWSDILRKVFEHERLAYNRRTNHEYRETESSRLAVLLSGTPAQVKPLIPSAENGLYSRQIFYTMPPINEWIDQFSDDGVNVETIFKKMGHKWKTLLDELRSIISMAELKLTKEQRGRFNDFFASLFTHASGTHTGHHMKSSVARLAINILRMMSVTAFLRALEEPEKWLRPAADVPSENIKDGVCSRFDLYISDDDFNATLALAEPLYRHASIVLELLPDAESPRKEQPPMETLISQLPLKFSRTYVLDIARKLGITENALDVQLHRLVSRGVLIRTEKGSYEFSSSTRVRVCAKAPQECKMKDDALGNLHKLLTEKHKK